MEYSNRSLELIGKQFLYSCIDVYLKLAVHLAAGHCLYWRPSDMEERGKQWHYLWALAVSFSWSCRAETWTKSQWHHGISCILWHDMARRRKLRCRLKNAQECRPLKHGSSHACAIGMCLLCFDSFRFPWNYIASLNGGHFISGSCFWCQDFHGPDEDAMDEEEFPFDPFDADEVFLSDTGGFGWSLSARTIQHQSIRRRV